MKTTVNYVQQKQHLIENETLSTAQTSAINICIYYFNLFFNSIFKNMNLDDYITGTFDTRNPANQGEVDSDFDELGFYKRQFKNQCIITKWHISNLMRLAELERIENLNCNQIQEKNEILQNYENTI